MEVSFQCFRAVIVCGIFGVTAIRATNYQLIFNPTSMSWIGAATWCQMKNGELVTVDSQSVTLMIEWYKDHDWAAHWNDHVWAGLYTYTSINGYWQGSCAALNYTNWASAQVYSATAPCIYMNSTDLHWHYDSCTSTNYVVCQIANGNCSFDDQNYAFDASLDPLPDVHAATLADCKVLCDNYQDGLIECWAIKYQSSAKKCFMYVSVNPTNYLSTKTNNNPNLVYSTRGCFTSSIDQESEPPTSLNISTFMERCLPDTTDLDSTTFSSSTTTDSLSTTTSVSDTTTTSESDLTTASTLLTDTTEDPATTINTQYTIISNTISESTIACTFRCPCGFGGGNLTNEMLQEILTKLKSILTVDKTKTSSYIRKHTSAKDNRPSSQVIGAIGSVFIIITLGLIVFSDVVNFIQQFKSNHLKRRKTLKRRDTMYSL